MTDARFEDAAPRPLRLQALTPEDLTVISSLVQDAVLPVADMTWDRKAGRFALLLNRFRWEDGAQPPQRVRSLLTFDNVTRVQLNGLDRGQGDQVLSLLSVTLEDDGAGERAVLTLAGDGAIAVTARALDVALRDVTQPHAAVSGKAPRHPD